MLGQCKYQRFIETGNGKYWKGIAKGKEGYQFGASLVMEVRNKHAHKKGNSEA